LSKIALTNEGTFEEVEFFLSSPWKDAYDAEYGTLSNFEVSYGRK
jgi:hypothetical protein